MNLNHVVNVFNSFPLFSCLKKNPLFEICPVSNLPYNNIYKPHIEYIKKAIGQNLSNI